MCCILFGVYVGVLLKYVDDDVLKYICGMFVEMLELFEVCFDDVFNCLVKLLFYAYIELFNFVIVMVCLLMGMCVMFVNVFLLVVINLMGGKMSLLFIMSIFVGCEIKKLINKL